jgi:hypothetical protein
MRNTNKIKKHSVMVLFLILGCAMMLFLPPATLAAVQIGKVASVKGDVLVNTAGDISPLKAGAAVNDGDIIQARDGEAQLTFNDGAQMRINPFTKIMMTERTEESGAWFFKSREQTRRVTCYVGKLWFKSGASPTKNYLQSPTAVAGLRGSDGDFGYTPDRLQTLLNMYSGDAATVGNVIRGFFDNPGVTAAQKSEVYQRLEQAYSLKQETTKVNQTTTLTEGQKAVNNAAAKVAALQVVQQAAQILVQSNPDPVVKAQAQATQQVVTAVVQVAQVQQQVAQTQVIREQAQQVVQQAQAAGDTQKAQQAQQVVQRATAAIQAESNAVQQAQQAVQRAETALAAGQTAVVTANVNQVQQVQQRVDQTVQAVQKIATPVITTTVATTIATTMPPTTIAPTTVATTVGPTTTATTAGPTTTATTVGPTTTETTVAPTTTTAATTSAETTIPTTVSTTSTSTTSMVTTTSP